MNKSLVKILAATAALSAPAIARAEPFIVYGPEAYASAYATAGGGAIRNGVAEGVSGDGAVLSGNATQGSAATGSGVNTASSQADLAAGTVRAMTSAGASVGSFAESEIADTLYFNNTSAGVIGLNFRFTLDGTIPSYTNAGFTGGFAIFSLDSCLGGCGGLTQGVNGPNADGIGDFALAGSEYLLFNPSGIYGFAEYTGASGPPAAGKYNYGSTFDDGYMTGFYETTVYIPAGVSIMGVRARLHLDCRFDAVCDFGHTGAIHLGPLADGLSYTSASGAFLSAVRDPTSAAPEPASWALMIFGFGMTGASLRLLRRKAVAA